MIKFVYICGSMAQYHSLQNSDGVRPTSIAASNPVVDMSLRELGANGDV